MGLQSNLVFMEFQDFHGCLYSRNVRVITLVRLLHFTSPPSPLCPLLSLLYPSYFCFHPFLSGPS